MVFITDCVVSLLLILTTCQTTTSQGIIHVPHTCQKCVELNENGVKDTVELVVSGNSSDWKNHAYGKTCDFRINRHLQKLSQKCHRVKVEIKSQDDEDLDRCHFDVHLYAGDKASHQQIKSLSCHHNTSLVLEWPSPSVIVSLSPTQCAAGAGASPEHEPRNVIVRVSLFTDNECRKDIDEKHALFQKASCGGHGCLDNHHHGYSIYAESTETQFCWFNVTLHRSRQLCLKQHFENEQKWRSCRGKRWHADIFINGFFVMKFGCDDLHNWWCLPWKVDGHVVSFRWQQNWHSCSSENYVRVISLSDNTRSQTCGSISHFGEAGAPPQVAPDGVEKEKYTVIIVIISLPLLLLIGFLLAIRMLVDKMKRRQDLRNQTSDYSRRQSTISQASSPPPYPGKLSKTNMNYLPSYQSALELPYYTSSYNPVLQTVNNSAAQSGRSGTSGTKTADAREPVAEALNIPNALMTSRNFNIYDGNSIRANFTIGDDIPINSNHDVRYNEIRRNSVNLRYPSEPNNIATIANDSGVPVRIHSINSDLSDYQENVAVVQRTLDSDTERISNGDESTDSDYL